MPRPDTPSPQRPRVVIVGAGFGGLEAAKALRDAPVDVTVIDRRNHHLFQPLLYQVATAGLAPASISAPIRAVLTDQPNAQVLLAEVVDVDFAARSLRVHDDEDHEIAYDYLVLAIGAVTSYFGNHEWRHYAPGLKSLDEAIEIRRRVLLAFEQAEREEDPLEREALLTFVVVGGGPTGVEMAGALAELSRYVLARDFRRIRPELTRVVLLEGLDDVLTMFDADLRAKAVAQLHDLGVVVRTGAMVTHIDERGVRIGDETIAARTVLWTAGVRANPLCERLGVETDKSGRVRVGADCTLAGHPEVFAIGDMARYEPEDKPGKPLPGVSPVAMQQGRYVAAAIRADLAGERRGRFTYHDKGTMATIGRSRAIAQTKRMRLTGTMAWLAWLVVHLWYLIGFRNRIIVLINWAWSYIAYSRGARLITGDRLIAGVPQAEIDAAISETQSDDAA
ncbi:MAG: NAD(P)/FAD-dependent oxidoreductase [Myxococcales bacterium]|nr:NAD(P)/FAD-dependent oxidoreductase [Myxococcales bacterium]